MLSYLIILFVILMLRGSGVSGSILKTAALTDKCIVEINGSEIIKNIGSKWLTKNPCIWHSCELNDFGEAYEELTNENCTIQCKDEFELRNVTNKCCGECVQRACKYENESYSFGDTWHSNDNCTFMQCDESNGTLIIISFNKTCPNIDNCLEEHLYEENCCQLCKASETDETVDKFQSITTKFHENDDQIYDENYYKNHPCNRKCIENVESKICHYEFVIEWYETLSKACFDCPKNLTDCKRQHCIYGDGARRSITVINRMMPGPSIEVCQNDTIIVDVKNNLLGESTTIHWHGLHQKDTPYMDGVPHISQCPIQPHTTFRYTFQAVNSGTHFWHSHTGMQRGDGAFGALIIRQPENVDGQIKLYDFDLFEHKIIIQDWAHITGVSMFASHHHSIGSNKPVNILVNGKGRYFPETFKELSDYPLEIFNVVKDNRYRFRIINAEFLNCPVSISVDNHTILAISSDGFDLEPVEIGSVVTYAGERFDIIIEANQPIGNYWIRFKGLMDCDERFTKAFQVAVLRYEGAQSIEPTETPFYEFVPQGIVLNALNKGPNQIDSLTIAELNSSTHSKDVDDFLMTEPDYKFFIYYDFYPKDNPSFHKKNLYEFSQFPKNQLFSPQLNHISLKMPSLPLMPARDQIDESMFCNATSLAAKGINCREEFCECSHVLQVTLGSVVEFIMIDEGVTYDANHPFHLHGNAFYVTGLDRIGSTVTVEKIQEMDKKGLLKRKLSRAPIKDTVTVPDGGYTIVRFKADNPGFWLFHCHIEFHAEIGMAFVLKVGDNNQMVPVPKNFPTCSDYMPNSKIDNIIERNGNNATQMHFSFSITVITLGLLLNFFLYI